MSQIKRQNDKINLTNSQNGQNKSHLNMKQSTRQAEFQMPTDSFIEEDSCLNAKYRRFSLILQNISTFGRQLLTYFLTVTFTLQQKQYCYKSKIIHGNSNDRTIFDLVIDINFPQNKIREHTSLSQKSKFQLSMLVIIQFTLKIDDKYQKIGLGKIVNPYVSSQQDIPIYHLANNSKKIAVATYKIIDFNQSIIFQQKFQESKVDIKGQQELESQQYKKKQQQMKDQTLKYKNKLTNQNELIKQKNNDQVKNKQDLAELNKQLSKQTQQKSKQMKKDQILIKQQQYKDEKNQIQQKKSITKNDFVQQIFDLHNINNQKNKTKKAKLNQQKTSHKFQQIPIDTKRKNDLIQQNNLRVISKPNQKLEKSMNQISVINEEGQQTQNKKFSGNLQSQYPQNENESYYSNLSNVLDSNNQQQLDSNNQQQLDSNNQEQQYNQHKKMIAQLSFLNEKIQKDLSKQKDQNIRYTSFLNQSNTFIDSLIKSQNQSMISISPKKKQKVQDHIKFNPSELQDHIKFSPSELQDHIKSNPSELQKWKKQNNADNQYKNDPFYSNQKQNKYRQTTINNQQQKDNSQNKYNQIKKNQKQLNNNRNAEQENNKFDVNSYQNTQKQLQSMKNPIQLNRQQFNDKNDNNNFNQFNNLKNNLLQISRISQSNNNNVIQLQDADLIKTISQISDSQQLWKKKQRNRLNSVPQKRLVYSGKSSEIPSQVTFNKGNLKFQQNNNQLQIKKNKAHAKEQNKKKLDSPLFNQLNNQSSISIQQQEMNKKYKIFVESEYGKKYQQKEYKNNQSVHSFVFLKNISLEFADNNIFLASKQEYTQLQRKINKDKQVYAMQQRKVKKDKQEYLTILSFKFFNNTFFEPNFKQTQKVNLINKIKNLNEDDKIFQIRYKALFFFKQTYKQSLKLILNKLQQTQIKLPIFQTIQKKKNQVNIDQSEINNFFVQVRLNFSQNFSQQTFKNKNPNKQFFGELDIKSKNNQTQMYRETIKLVNQQNLKFGNLKCNVYLASQTCIQTFQQLESNLDSQNDQRQNFVNIIPQKLSISGKKLIQNNSSSKVDEKQDMKLLFSKRKNQNEAGKIYRRQKKFVKPTQKIQHIIFVQNKKNSPSEVGKHQPKKSGKKLLSLSFQNEKNLTNNSKTKCEMQNQQQQIKDDTINKLKDKTQYIKNPSNRDNNYSQILNLSNQQEKNISQQFTKKLPDKAQKINLISNTLYTSILPTKSVSLQRSQIQSTIEKKNQQNFQMNNNDNQSNRTSYKNQKQKSQMMDFLQSPIQKANQSQQPSLLQLQIKNVPNHIKKQQKQNNQNNFKIIAQSLSPEQSLFSYLNNQKIKNDQQLLNPNQKNVQKQQFIPQIRQKQKFNKQSTKFNQSTISNKTQDVAYRGNRVSQQPDYALSQLHSEEVQLIQKFHENVIQQQDYSTIRQKKGNKSSDNISLKVIIQTLSIKILNNNKKFTNGRYVRIYVSNILKNKKIVSQCIQTDIVNCNNHLFWNWNLEELSFYGSPQTQIVFQICQSNDSNQEKIIGSHKVSFIQLVQVQKISMYSNIVEKSGRQVAKIVFGYIVNSRKLKKNKEGYSEINKSRTSIKKHPLIQQNDTHRMTQVKQKISNQIYKQKKHKNSLQRNQEIRSSKSFNIRPRYSSHEKISRPTQDFTKKKEQFGKQGSFFMMQSRVSAIKSKRNQKIFEKKHQIKKYMGGNIKIPKASRFITEEQQLKMFQQNIPGPGTYQIPSYFQRHAIKQL